MSQKKIAIMQPYLFPYLGYFQLIQAVDVFVFYDDVNFIKQGWINRNNILQNGKSNLFTVPLKKASSFSKINEVEINQVIYNKWIIKFWKTIDQNYGKAPYYEDVLVLLKKVFEDSNKTISEMAVQSIEEIINYLNIEKDFKLSSEEFISSVEEDKADRIISITKKLKGDLYINPKGGEKLYNKDYFFRNGVNISFIQPSFPKYKQLGNDFVSGLSIVDLLMFNSKKSVRKMITKFELA